MGVVALAVLVLVSFFVEAAAGFGSMVVALTVGALFSPVDELLGLLVPVNLVLSTYLVARNRAHVDWRAVAGVQRDSPVSRLDCAQDAASERAFAAARLADQPQRLVAANHKRHVVDGFHMPDHALQQAFFDREIFLQMLDFEQNRVCVCRHCVAPLPF